MVMLLLFEAWRHLFL